ncbi:SusC/RagA family TonB-linked outer membrane protein [Polaribacter porphyrae]|uniref:SusC/RagA family TonB-linked outer membrane protein n=1 Tax=Polaribacter porphyrae TaxID=1137780 RepID=A0A2S7WQX5_9FLAO|nr:SusC/RagA family TonB-linked outer membrane protein [Polaribacter porphyrae]PQJ79712.1 hypothetical protein BTO18_11250 [Polaribacter porphyrae]
MIKKILLITMLLSTCYLSSQKTVTGTVKDNTGLLPNVSISEKGTKKGVVTDFDGKFSIKVSKDNSILVFRYLGYKTLELSVENKLKIVVVLEEDAESLDEIVVNALGIQVDKRTLGATVSTLKSEDIENTGEVNLINALQGKVSGVRIARSNGDPGAGSIIQFRGANTITGNSQPLIILDGVPISNDNFNGSNDPDGGTSQQSRLNDISDDDIETINFLKGASAAAVWGSQAANGVIVITTKRGKNTGKIKVRYRSSYYMDEISRMHGLQETFGQGRGGVYSNTITDSFSWGDRISERSGAPDVFFPKDQEGYFLDQNNREWLRIQTKNSQETFVQSNQDQVIQKAFSTKQFISMSNANDNGSYYLSFSHANQNGIIKRSNYKRTSAFFSGRYKFDEKLKVNTRIRYTRTESNRIQQGSNFAGLFLGLLRASPDFDISGYEGTYFDTNGVPSRGRQRSYRNPIGASANPGYNNALWTVFNQESPSVVDRIIFSSDFDYKVNHWLSLKLRPSYDTYFDERRYFFPINTAGRGAGRFQLDNINRSIFNVDFIARTKTFSLNENLNGNFILGYNYNSQLRKSVYNRAQQFLINSDAQTFTNNSDPELPRNFITRRRKFRVFYTAGFEYKNQFFLNTTAAVEKASTINGAFFYPSVDFSWLFSETEVIGNLDFVNTAKLRLGVGQVGVEPLPHRAQTTYESPTYSDFGDPLELLQFGGGFRFNNNLGNPNLKPEIKTEYEAGLDFSLFDKRLKLNVTYYFNEIRDILFRVPLSPSSGADNIYDNGATMQNRGIEIDFDYKFINQRKGLKASIYGNFNNNRNEVTQIKGTNSIPLTTQSISSRAVLGEQLGVLWGSRARRNADGSFDLDANGFPQIAEEEGVIGDPNPDWRGGAGLKLNYKNFSANILVEHSQGGAFAERTRFILSSFGTHADVGNVVTPDVPITDYAGVVHPAGVEVRGNIKDFGAGPVLLNEPYYTTVQGFGDSVINEFAINQDASWTRLSEVTLGYTLKSKRFKKATKLSSATINITGRNLFLWSDIQGVDPQTNQTGVTNGFGIDYFTNPATRTFLVSLNVSF